MALFVVKGKDSEPSRGSVAPYGVSSSCLPAGTLIYRNAKETPQDPCAGKYSMIKTRKYDRILVTYYEAYFKVGS